MLFLVYFVAFVANHAEGFRATSSEIGGVQRFISPDPKLGLTTANATVKTKDKDSAMQDGLKVVTDFIEGQNDGQEFGQIFGVTKNSEGDLNAFVSALAFGTLMLFFTVTVFTCLRRCSPLIYAHRILEGDTGGEQSLPPSHDGCFGWAVAAWNLTDHEVMQAAGLDALMFLEFCRLFMKLTFFVSPLVIGVLCPLHYYTERVNCGAFQSDAACLRSRCVWMKHHSQAEPAVQGGCQAKYAKDFLSFIGINGLLQGAEPLSVTPFWIHAGMVWVVVCLTLYFMQSTHLRFLKHRFHWLTHLQEPRSTTLMVENIPLEYRSDEKLKGYFNHLFTEAAIEKAYVVRKTGPLCQKVAQLEAKEAQLRAVEKLWERDGRHPDKIPKVKSFMSVLSDKKDVNAIELYSEQVRDLKAELTVERQRVEEAAAHSDPSVVSSSGFVTFTSRRWCRHASQEQYREDTREWVIGMPPDPSDVVYTDLAKTEDVQARGNLIAVFLIVLMFVIWTPLVALTSSLTSLAKLSTVIPFLQAYCNNHPYVNDFLQGVLATFALKFLMGWLPIFLMGIIRSFLSLKSGAWAQLKLLNRFFVFQITFVLFVTTVGVSFGRTIQNIMDRPKDILGLLAARLPEASHFYLNYVLLGWFTVSLGLLRAPQMCYYLWNTRISGMDTEMARAAVEPEDQDCYGMGARFGQVSLIMVLTIVFSTVMPFIVPVGAVFFFLCNIIFAYLAVFAETKKPDLGGLFWIASMRHIMFALVLYVALMGGIISSQGHVGRYPAAALCPVLLVLFLAWQRLNQFSWEILPFESVADMDHEFSKRKSMIGTVEQTGEYIQPECVEPDDP